jgi:tetratricopeptide (TPR) repeat protein
MEFDPYVHWLQISPDRLPPSYYDLFGLPEFESDAGRIQAAALKTFADVRRFQMGPQANEAMRLLDELSRAYTCLSDPARKAEYDAGLRAGMGQQSTRTKARLPASVARKPTKTDRSEKIKFAMGVVGPVAVAAPLLLLGVVFFGSWGRDETARPVELPEPSTNETVFASNNVADSTPVVEDSPSLEEPATPIDEASTTANASTTPVPLADNAVEVSKGGNESATDDASKTVTSAKVSIAPRPLPDPRDAAFYSQRAEARRKAGDFRGSIEDFTKLIELTRGTADSHFGRGSCYAELGEWNKAASDFQRAAALRPSEPWYPYYQAMCYLAAGNHTSFAQIVKKLLDRVDGHTDPVLVTRLAYAAASTPGTVADTKRLVELAESLPNEANANRVRAVIFYRDGQYEKGLEVLSAAMESSAPRESDHLYFAMMCHEMGKAAEAQRSLDAATQWRELATAAKTDIDWYERAEIDHLRKEGFRPDRSVAVWAIQKGGYVCVAVGGGGGNSGIISQISRLPNTPFELDTVRLNGKGGIGNEDLSRLVGLRRLRRVELAGNGFTDRALEQLPGLLPRLTDIFLGDSRITEAGLRHLKPMQHLSGVLLESTKFSDKCVPELLELSSLRTLYFNNTSITDEGVRELAALAGLHHVELHSNKRMTEASVRYLDTFPSLQYLYLAGPYATDQAISGREFPRRLKSLSISGSSFSDIGLKSLYGSTALTRLTLSGTDVSPQGVEDFRAAMPNVKDLRYFPSTKYQSARR